MTFPVPRCAALSSLALAMLAPYAVAQNAPTSTAAVIVTASRVPQPAADVLADNVLINADDILRSGATSIVDLLQKQRGVEVARNGGPGTTSSVYLRGANANQTIVLVDGVRIGSSTTGTANWTALPLPAIDHIEIVFGPLATMYGADAIGGVVQIFTRRSDTLSLAGSASFGSAGTRTVDGSITGASAGDHRLSYAFAAAREQDTGFSATRLGSSSFNQDNDGYKKDSASGRLALAVSADNEIGAQFLHSNLQAQYDNGTSAYDVHTTQSLDNLALFSNNRLTRDWTLNVQVNEANDKSFNDSSAAASGKSSIQTRQHNYSAQNAIAFGSDLLQVLVERREEAVVSSSTPALTTGRSTNSVAASYSLKRGDNLAIASVRNDDSSQYGSKTTGGLGYGYRITRALRVNATAGTSFRAPTFNELYYPGFGFAGNRPEKGKNVEGGVYYNDGQTEASAVAYRNRITDLLVTANICPVELATHAFGCAYNIDRATLSGLTLGARTRLGGFDVRGSLDIQDPRDDTTAKSLARRAKRHASVDVNYTVGALTGGAGLAASGKRFDDAANKTVLGGYSLVNLFAAYQVTSDWSLELRVNNAFDKQYELARFYNTAGRQVFAGLRFGAR
jgi:vitamin B12 transporter